MSVTYCNMATIPTRIDTNALDILKQYSPGSASEAIRIMDNTIRTLQSVTHPVTNPTQIVTVPLFSRGNGSPSPVTYRPGKQTEVAKKASEPKVPIRIIGKIDPSEALEEPTGRQGRSV